MGRLDKKFKEYSKTDERGQNNYIVRNGQFIMLFGKDRTNEQKVKCVKKFSNTNNEIFKIYAWRKTGALITTDYYILDVSENKVYCLLDCAHEYITGWIENIIDDIEFCCK